MARRLLYGRLNVLVFEYKKSNQFLGGGHKTMSMVQAKEQPAYDDIRDLMLDSMICRAAPISSSNC